MAALHLHNAVFSPPDSRLSSSRHIRNLSNLSADETLPSGFSHPTEPLLISSTSESIAYRDLLSRQPNHPDGLEVGQDLGLSFEGDEITPEERKWRQVRQVKRQLRWLKVARGALEVLFGVWKSI